MCSSQQEQRRIPVSQMTGRQGEIRSLAGMTKCAWWMENFDDVIGCIICEKGEKDKMT